MVDADFRPKAKDAAATGNPGLGPITVRIPDAVRATGISRSRLYELIKAGEIETVKVGTSTLVLVASLKGFIEGLRRPERRSVGDRMTPLICTTSLDASNC